MIPRFPVYLFDLDGTLLDSAADISAAVLEVLAANGRPDVVASQVRSYIGRHLLDMFLELGFDPDKIDPMIASYREIYRRAAGGEPVVIGPALRIVVVAGRPLRQRRRAERDRKSVG